MSQILEGQTTGNTLGEVSKEGYVVVMTACIDPSTGPIKIERMDPTVRLNDYRSALRFWLNISDCRLDKIVFIENSGYSLETLKQIVEEENLYGKDCELLSIQCNNFPEGVHYGYGEFCMIDKALSCSRLLNSTRYMIKATGRLTFPEISRLLNRLPDDYLFAADTTKLNLLGGKYSRCFVSTQIILFSIDFYCKNLRKKYQKLIDHRQFSSVENLFYKELMPYLGQASSILRFPVNCRPSGQSGCWEESYDSPKRRIINTMRGICRVLLPNLWF
jgi:hypothetical protein